MRGLFIKDLKFMKMYKWMYIMLAICTVCFVISDNPGMVYGYILILGITTVSSTISYDEFDNGNAFLFSLPITRKDYVRGKYLLSLAVTAVSLLLIMAVCLLVSALGKVDMDFEIYKIGFIIPVMILVIAVTLPIQLKYGGEKGKIVKAMLLGVMCALLLIVTESMDNKLIQDLIYHGINPVNSGLLAFILAMALSCIILFISYLISISVMKKKEL